MSRQLTRWSHGFLQGIKIRSDSGRECGFVQINTDNTAMMIFKEHKNLNPPNAGSEYVPITKELDFLYAA
jgi:hypothetical protein